MSAARHRVATAAAPIADVLLAPLTFAAAYVLRLMRRLPIARMPVSRRIFRRIGVFPIRDQYYEPLFNDARLRYPLDRERELPGIDWNIDGQLALLRQFRFQDELLALPMERRREGGVEFYYQNDTFGSGDAEYLYSVIRLFRPSRIIEIGSGYSTMIAAAAVSRSRRDDATYQCAHICIEPYENPWLESLGVTVIRSLAETVDRAVFASLGANDVLILDSSHVIRPQGDVLFEYLELVPGLPPGVLVHVHDIFSPRDYPRGWVVDEMRLWNEQYLLEAYLSGTRRVEIIGALNLLAHRYPDALAAACPVFGRERALREPGSFWMRTRAERGPGQDRDEVAAVQ